MCLERVDKGNIKDDVSDVRKAKSLVERWLERSPVADKNDMANKLPEEALIERDSVVYADVAVGRGRSSVKVSKQYRVTDTHNKYKASGSWEKSHKNLWEGLQVQSQGSHVGSKCSAGVQRCRSGRWQTQAGGHQHISHR